MLISIIIRTLNEDRHLEELLQNINLQQLDDSCEVEVVIVDSGSTDSTLQIAAVYKSRIVHIHKNQFTFGRSLNVGCDVALGEYLVFVSGHCIPADSLWLKNLIHPLIDGEAVYTYGRQIGKEESNFSECQLYKKNFPERSQIHHKDIFCNNANSAICKDIWVKYRFDEKLTGLEDLELATRIHAAGMKIVYVATAPVYHLHYENLREIKNRFEREAIALQYIRPEIQVSFADMMRYFLSSVFLDMSVALQERKLCKVVGEIVTYRFVQFLGSYRGNNEHRKLSQKMKEKYFYPR